MRPRNSDRHLPSCVYLKHGSYYLVKRGKWVRLGSTLHEALQAYAKALSKPTEGVPGLLERWYSDAQKELAASTIKTYRIVVERLSGILSEFQPAEVTARDITTILHHHRDKPAMANHMRTVMICALEFAYMEGLVERNVARDTRPLKTKARDRYLSDAEYFRIREKATPTLAAMMDILFLTGQRISDVLKLAYSDISEEGIYFRQQKTGNKLLVSWSPELRSAVSQARGLHSSVRGLTLFHTRGGKPFAYSTIRTLWDRATKAAGVDDAHIHDIRAKAGTDAKSAGIDSQKLLGHKTESSHQRYLRSKETPVATPASFRQKRQS